MSVLRIQEWYGNSGFTLTCDGAMVAEVQGISYADGKPGDRAWWLFESIEGDVRDDLLFFMSRKSLFHAVAENLNATDDYNIEKCSSCGTPLVLHSLDGLEWCHVCGVVHFCDGKPTDV